MKNQARMIEWLMLAVGLYVTCNTLRMLQVEPQAQIVLWKLANVTVAAFLGYWIDRRAFPHARMTADAMPIEQVRRAIIIAAAMLAVAMGL
jgi:hypothetical protein